MRKRMRAALRPPDKPLGKPVRPFSQTFSAFTVLRDTFFTPKPERLAAAAPADDPVTIAANRQDF